MIPYHFVFKVQDNYCQIPKITYRTVTINVRNPGIIPATQINCITTAVNGDVTVNWDAVTDPDGTFVVCSSWKRNNGTCGSDWKRTQQTVLHRMQLVFDKCSVRICNSIPIDGNITIYSSCNAINLCCRYNSRISNIDRNRSVGDFRNLAIIVLYFKHKMIRNHLCDITIGRYHMITIRLPRKLRIGSLNTNNGRSLIKRGTRADSTTAGICEIGSIHQTGRC